MNVQKVSNPGSHLKLNQRDNIGKILLQFTAHEGKFQQGYSCSTTTNKQIYKQTWILIKIEKYISTDIAQLAYYIIADAKWTNRSINGSSSVRFSVIISTNDLYVAVEARSPTWPVGSISVVAQCSIHCTAQRCTSITSRSVKIHRPLKIWIL